MRFARPAILLAAVIIVGCGTTRWSDTRRTATEQLLISDAMDRAVSRFDFRAVAGKKIYLDATYIKYTTDSDYLISSMRQHMLAGGCILMDRRDDADYIVEVRAGAVGTDRRDVLFGVPATKVPAMLPVPGVPTNIPELPLATKTEQRAVAKIAVFAYNRHTGRPIWQSGVVPVESTAKDIWFLGAGPFQRGTIYDGTSFAGDKIKIPLIYPGDDDEEGTTGEISVADQAYFAEPVELLADQAEPPEGVAETKPQPEKGNKRPGGSQGVVRASHVEPAKTPVPPKKKPKPSPPTEKKK